MKAFLILAAILGFSSSAFAGVTCKTYWGTTARVAVSGNKLMIRFNGGRYDSAVLTANGQSGSSYYFRDTASNGLAIVNKSVLSNGTGNIYYSYGEGGHHNGGATSVTLYCGK